MLTLDSLNPIASRSLSWLLTEVQDMYRHNFNNHSDRMERKHDGSYVGDLDRAIAISCHDKFPNCLVITEEDDTVTWPPATNGICLLVDPLCGTHNHGMGLPTYGTMIFMVKNRQPFAAVILLPIQEQLAKNGLYLAVRNQGAYQFNSQTHSLTPIRVSSKTDLAKALILFEGSSKKQEASAHLIRIAKTTKRKRVNISMALASVLVASGSSYPLPAQALVVIDNHPWDNLAACLLIEEAGGLVTDFENNPWTLTTRNIVAANPGLHAGIMATINQANS